MKTKNSNLRYRFLLLVLSCYLLPLLLLISYNAFLENDHQDWSLLSFGVFLSTIGTLIFFCFFSKYEQSSQFSSNQSLQVPSVDEISQISEKSNTTEQNQLNIDPNEFEYLKLSLAEAQQMQIRLLAEIDTIAEELQAAKKENVNLIKAQEKFISETKEENNSFSKQLEDQQTHIRGLQQTIAEQKAQLEKKELHSSSLESKVGDLTYEIKTLLQLAEAHTGSLFNETNESPPPNTLQTIETEPNKLKSPPQTKLEESHDGSYQLKRCITIAQKITGSQRFGSQLYSTLESPVESFSIDLRRLCDRLRMEIISTNCTILLYSPRDSELLFAGNQIRDLTGWSPEKFTQTFHDVLEDENCLKNGISSLSMRSEAVIPLSIKTRAGQTATFQTHLGMIPTGIFRNHVIALLVH